MITPLEKNNSLRNLKFTVVEDSPKPFSYLVNGSLLNVNHFLAAQLLLDLGKRLGHSSAEHTEFVAFVGRELGHCIPESDPILENSKRLRFRRKIVSKQEAPVSTFNPDDYLVLYLGRFSEECQSDLRAVLSNKRFTQGQVNALREINAESKNSENILSVVHKLAALRRSFDDGVSLSEANALVQFEVRLSEMKVSEF